MDDTNEKNIESAPAAEEESLEAKVARLIRERDEAIALAETAAAQRSGPPPRFDTLGVTTPWPPCGVCGQRHQKGQCSLCPTCHRQPGCAFPVQTMDGAATCTVCGSYPQLPPSQRFKLTGSREVGRPAGSWMPKYPVEK